MPELGLDPQAGNGVAVINKVRPVARVAPGKRARDSQRLVNGRGHVFGFLRIRRGVGPDLVGRADDRAAANSASREKHGLRSPMIAPRLAGELRECRDLRRAADFAPPSRSVSNRASRARPDRRAKQIPRDQSAETEILQDRKGIGVRVPRLVIPRFTWTMFTPASTNCRAISSDQPNVFRP